MGLETYHKKRDFSRTPEPKGKLSKTNRHRFVCQEHHASSLHFDFRLEAGGVLKSWSLRKGPSMNPTVRRLAVPTEDHPVEYLKFEGDIPDGNYGAGQHRIWDAGTYYLLEADDPKAAIENGKLKVELKGKKLKGIFNLFRLGQRDQWLLVKSKDEHADPAWKLELLMPDEDGNTFISEDNRTPRTARRRARRTSSDAGVVKLNARPEKGEKLPGIAAVLRGKGLKGDRRVKVGDHPLELTSLDRVYWPEDGITKADLIRYYYRISKYILPYLTHRPLIMKRYPLGIRGESFHQHDVDEVPEFVRTIGLQAEDGGAHEVDYTICENVETNLYLTNLGAIERHPWHARVDSTNKPDWFVFDLDPGEDVKFATICEVAVTARDVMESLGLRSYPKTSGSRGIHLYVPIKREYTFETVADMAARIAAMVAAKDTKIATVERSKKKRTASQIYIDHLQNAYGKSVVAPYSVRPRPGATVSTPLDWDEVSRGKISTQDFTIKNLAERIRDKGEIFRPVLDLKQNLDEALERLKPNGKRTH